MMGAELMAQCQPSDLDAVAGLLVLQQRLEETAQQGDNVLVGGPLPPRRGKQVVSYLVPKSLGLNWSTFVLSARRSNFRVRLANAGCAHEMRLHQV
jgi:hypothetical protein